MGENVGTKVWVHLKEHAEQGGVAGAGGDLAQPRENVVLEKGVPRHLRSATRSP